MHMALEQAVEKEAKRRKLTPQMDATTSSFKDRAMEYLSSLKEPLQRKWRAFSLARELNKLEVPAGAEAHEPDETSQNAEGLYKYLSISKIRRTFGISNSTTPQLLRYAALAAPLVMVQAGAVGCASGATLTQSNSSSSCDSRISLRGTNIDPKLEDAVNSLKDYICYRFVTKGYTERLKPGLADKLKAFIRQEKGAPLTDKDMGDITSIKPLAKYLMPHGLFLTDNFFDETRIVNIHRVYGIENHLYSREGRTEGYKVVLLGEKIFSTYRDRDLIFGAKYWFEQQSKPKELVIAIPYNLLKKYSSRYNSKEMENLKMYWIKHEEGHAFKLYSIDGKGEQSATLYGLSGGRDFPNINNARDIANYLRTQTLDFNMGLVIDDLSDMGGLDRVHAGAQYRVHEELNRISTKINRIDPRFSADTRYASRQQIEAMAYLALKMLWQRNK